MPRIWRCGKQNYGMMTGAERENGDADGDGDVDGQRFSGLADGRLTEFRLRRPKRSRFRSLWRLGRDCHVALLQCLWRAFPVRGRRSLGGILKLLATFAERVSHLVFHWLCDGISQHDESSARNSAAGRTLIITRIPVKSAANVVRYSAS